MANDEDFTVKKTDDEWRATLSPEQYQVLRQHGTEMRGASPLNTEKRHGRFYCAACGEALFSSEAKYNSGTGWPSFFGMFHVKQKRLRNVSREHTGRAEKLRKKKDDLEEAKVGDFVWDIPQQGRCYSEWFVIKIGYTLPL